MLRLRRAERDDVRVSDSGAVEIRAAVCAAFGRPLEVTPVLLDHPAEGEVRIRLEAFAICHSDVAYAAGAWVERYRRCTAMRPAASSRRWALG